MITKAVVAEALLSPEDLARDFWEMDANGQAEFFNELGLIAEEYAFRAQIDAVEESSLLSDAGRLRMNEMSRK